MPEAPRKTNRQGGLPRRRRAAKPETPIRNGLSLLVLAALLAALVILLPKQRATYSVSTQAVGGQSGGVLGFAEAVPLRFSEVMSSNQAAYLDEKGAFPDWVELENTGDAPLNIGGLGLSDKNDRVSFVFPDMELPPGGFVIVFCDNVSSMSPTSLHAQFQISSQGETLYLYDHSGQVVDRVAVPALIGDAAYARTRSGWVTTMHATPGYPNTEDAYAQMRQDAVSAARGLIINELMAANDTTLKDEDGDYSDWIELYNGGDKPIDLSHYALSDAEDKPLKWRFPQGAVIEPHGYYLVFASGKNKYGGGELHPHTPYKLAAEGETLILSDIFSQEIGRVSYENLAPDVSWGRVSVNSASFQEMKHPTPGEQNIK